MFEYLAKALIKRAMKTPYFHLVGYMERFWLFRLFRVAKTDQAHFAARIHHILRSDDDRAFHDHPWPYMTIILRGGYTEVRPVFDKSGLYRGETRKWYGPGSVLFRKARSWHRLELPEGQSAWTLFITGPKSQAWGFLTEPRHKVYYRDYQKVGTVSD